MSHSNARNESIAALAARKNAKFKWGTCRNFGGPYLMKPSDKLYCRSLCRDAYHNRERGRITEAGILSYVSDHWLTVRDAERTGIGNQNQIRHLIRTGRLTAHRIHGRVLLNRAEVLERGGIANG